MFLNSLLHLFILFAHAQTVATPSAIPTLVVSPTSIEVSPSVIPTPLITITPIQGVTPTIVSTPIVSSSEASIQSTNAPTAWPTEIVTPQPTWTYMPLPTKENPLPPPILPMIIHSLNKIVKNSLDPTLINPFGKMIDPYTSTNLSVKQTTTLLLLAFLSITSGVVLVRGNWVFNKKIEYEKDEFAQIDS